MLDREQSFPSFKAYEFRTSLLFQMKQHNILVSVGVSKNLLFLSI